MIHGNSPRFKAPWSAWRVTELGTSREAPDGGRLDLRIGYCLGADPKTPAEKLETIDRRRRAGDPVASKGDLRSSLVPVAMVDGEPVATGWGRVDLPLAAGRHLVEVQSQHSRAWRAVDIEPGRTVKLDYIGMLGDQHRKYATGEVRGEAADYTGYTLGPRGRLDFWQYLPANARNRRSFIAVLLAMFASAALAWGLGALGADAGVAVLVGAALWVGALAFWGVRILWTYLRYNRLAPEAPLDTSPIAPTGTIAPLVIDHDGTPPETSPDASAVLIDARFLKADLESSELALQLPQGQWRIDGRQRRALDALGEIVPVKHRFAVTPPRIEIDGVPVAASWTRMWITLAPGRHRVRASTPDAPLHVASGAAPPETGTVEIDVAQGETVALDLIVIVKAVPDPAEALLHAWDCRIEAFTSASEAPSRFAPKADVRGGIRRAATGRWWEKIED